MNNLLINKWRGDIYAQNIPAQEEAEEPRTWLQEENEYQKWKKRFKKKKVEGKKGFDSIEAAGSGLFVLFCTFVRGAMLKKTVLRRKSDFKRLYNSGKSVNEKCIVMILKKNALPYNRMAFLASKKIGNSVARNRARRLMKESYRIMDEKFGPGYDVAFIARKTICGLKCGDVKRSMESAIKRAGRIKERN